MSRKTTIVLLLFVITVSFSGYAKISAENVTIFQDSTKVEKEAAKKLSFFKKLFKFKRNDSVKLAKKFIHQHHKLLKDGNNPNFPTEIPITTLKDSLFKTSKDFELGYEVFGWYPYWETDHYKYLNYSLLSTVAYFAYELDPKTGKAKTVHDWATTPLIDSIQKYPNKNVLLTVTNFGEKNNKKFLKNEKAVDELIKNVLKLLADRNANGICIDFEGVSKKQKVEYTNFLLSLSNHLKKENPDYKLYVAVPAVDWRESLDFKSIIQSVDRFVVMGYDYYGRTSSVAGPVAPLESGKEWEPFNLTTSVDYYLANNIPSNKLLLALPTYGSLWETKSQSLKSKAKKFIGNRTFSYIKSQIEPNEKIFLEPISKSAYSAFTIKGKKNEYRQCWFENDSSFVYKTKLIKDKKLAGLGLWALGFDKGYNDIWRVIDSELAKPPEIDSTAVASDSTATKTSTGILSKISKVLGLTNPNSKVNKVEKKLVQVTDYKYVLLYTLSFVLFFACIGFLGAMLFPNTRASFFNNASLKGYYIATMLLIAIVVFRMQGWIDDATIILIIGFLLGVLAFYVANLILERKNKDLP